MMKLSYRRRVVKNRDSFPPTVPTLTFTPAGEDSDSDEVFGGGTLLKPGRIGDWHLVETPPKTWGFVQPVTPGC